MIVGRQAPPPVIGYTLRRVILVLLLKTTLVLSLIVNNSLAPTASSDRSPFSFHSATTTTQMYQCAITKKTVTEPDIPLIYAVNK